MDDLITLNKFGATQAIELIVKQFGHNLNIDKSSEAFKNKRDLLTYGTYKASQQWSIALKDNIPKPDNSLCFICKLKCKNGGSIWNNPEIEHLLPSAFAFIMFGLPGKFHQKWHKATDFYYKEVFDMASSVGEIMDKIQVLNYEWCHKYCNVIKKDSIFIDIIKIQGCTDKNTTCTIITNNANKININDNEVDDYINRLRTSNSPMKYEWENEIQKANIQDNTIKGNIQTAFQRLIEILKIYNRPLDYSASLSLLDLMILFNLRIGLVIVYMHTGKTITDNIIKQIRELYNNINEIQKTLQTGGGDEIILNNLLNPKEFEDFFKIGEAIKYYSELPDEGVARDNEFANNYVRFYPEKEDDIKRDVFVSKSAANPEEIRTDFKRRRNMRNTINNINNANNYRGKQLNYKRTRRNTGSSEGSTSGGRRFNKKYKKTRKNKKY